MRICVHPGPSAAFPLLPGSTIVPKTVQRAGVHCDEWGRDVRFHRDRGRLGRLSGRGAAQRKRQVPGLAARSRRPRPQSVDSYPTRVYEDLHRPARQLDVRKRARAAAQRPHAVPAARQGAGRHQLDQRHGLYARHPGRLRYWRQRGCEGWDWDSVLPFFRKAEHQERGADEFHGVGGPLRVSNPVHSPLGDAMVQAAIEAGIPANLDFNGARQEGVGYYQTTTGNRARWSAAKAYLKPARTRSNFTIVTKAHATRILIEDGRAVGVEYRTPDGLFTARCRGEVIVSGGVYGSPQLLQLSGLGPAEHIAQHGIPVVRDMPGVGSHLHDHFNTYLVWRCAQPVTVNDLAMSGMKKAAGRRAIRLHALGAPVECRDLCRRACQKRPAPRTARSADQHVRLERAGAAAHRHQAAPVLGLYLFAGASAPRGARHGTPQKPGPAGAARDPLQLPCQRL